MQHAGNPAAEPDPRPGDPADPAGTTEPVDPFVTFLSEATRLRDRDVKKRKKRKKDGIAPRPDDWADPDPRAALRLPAGRHPVDLAINRCKKGAGRYEFARKVRVTCEMLSHAEPRTMTSDDVRAYPWHQLTVEAAAEFREQVYARYTSQGSRNDPISVVRRVLRQCYQQGLMSALRTDRLLEELYTVAPGPSRMRRRLTAPEILALMTTCTEIGLPRRRARNCAIIALFRTSGLRVSELVRIDLADWDRLANSIWLLDTKNGADHLLHLHPQAVPYLELWLTERGTAPGPLFTKLPYDEPTRLTTHSVRYMLRATAKAAGVQPFGSHDFRRTFATDLLETHDAVLVSKLMNHRKVQSTMRYDVREDLARLEAVTSLGFPALEDVWDDAPGSNDTGGEPGDKPLEAGSDAEDPDGRSVA